MAPDDRQPGCWAAGSVSYVACPACGTEVDLYGVIDVHEAPDGSECRHEFTPEFAAFVDEARVCEVCERQEPEDRRDRVGGLFRHWPSCDPGDDWENEDAQTVTWEP
jgi:hypothetical protein